MEKLIIIGAGGHGKVVADIAKKIGYWNDIVFADDDSTIRSCFNIPVICSIDESKKFVNKADYIVAIGNNSVREKVQTDLILNGNNIVSLVHPNAVIGDEVEIDIGTMIMAGVVINSSCKIGKGCIINTSSSIDHDSIIEDYVHISPGARIAGTVKISRKSWIGIGATVINNINICNNCTIGAGAVIISDIYESGTYIGVPAKKLITK